MRQHYSRDGLIRNIVSKGINELEIFSNSKQNVPILQVKSKANTCLLHLRNFAVIWENTSDKIKKTVQAEAVPYKPVECFKNVLDKKQISVRFK